MISILCLLIGVCILSFAGSAAYFDTLVIAIILLFNVALMFDIWRTSYLRRYSAPLAIGYFLRVFLLFYDVYSNDPLNLPLVGGPLSSDPYNFYRTAIYFARGFKTSYGGFFPKFLGTLFKITGESRLWAEFVVLLFSVGTILVFVRILCELDLHERGRKRAVYLICLLPNYAFLSVILRRETAISFFVALSVLYFIRWFQGYGGEKAFLLAAFFALMASLFHGATGVIIAGYLLVRILYSPRYKAFTLEALNIIGAIAFFGVILFIASRYGTVFFDKIAKVLRTGNYSITSERGGSSYAQYVGDNSTLLNMVLYTIPRFCYYMFSPFPWQWRGLSDVLAFLMSGLVYMIIFINAFRYIVVSRRGDPNRNLLIGLLLCALLISVVFSWGVTNTGTATRHRDKFIALLCVMYAISDRTGVHFRIR